MNYPSSSSFQSNNQRTAPRNPLAAPKSEEKDSFKTSNPQIFPSLHPLSNFYSQKKIVRPNPMLSCKNESFEQVKKVKLNNGHEQIVPNTINATNTKKPSQEVKIQKETNKRSDDGVFRVPRLPSRLLAQNKALNSNEKAENQVRAANNITAFKQCVGATDSFNQCRRDLQSAQGNSQRTQTLGKKAVVKGQSSRGSRINPETGNIWQSQGISQDSQGMNSQMFNAIYERLSLEYLSHYLKQNSQQLFDIAQNNQDKLVQGFRLYIQNQQDLAGINVN